MQIKNTLVALAAGAAGVAAQRPTNTSICDYYTTALLKNNTAANQYTVLTLVVNTAVIGNFSKINTGVKVAGILAPGMVNGTAVNLLPYFDGTLASSNRGGMAGVSVNFLDGGGATPLIAGMAANNMTSNQYFLLTHLYEYFGGLLGCSMMGQDGFPSYMGEASQYNVHKFMDLNVYQLTYFIQQVGMSALSFGVTMDDVTAVGKALNGAFNIRCAPPTTIVMAQGPQLQSICIDGDCPLSPNSTCASYAPVVVPLNVTASKTFTAPGSFGTATVAPSGASSMMSGSATMMMSGTATTMMASGTATTKPSSVASAGAGQVIAGAGMAALAGGFAVLMA